MVQLLLTWALYVGPTAAGLIVALRAVPWVGKKLEAATKPWACDACMGFWTVGLTVMLVVAATRDRALLFGAGPAYPLCLWVLRQVTARGNVALPMLEPEDDK